MISVNYLGFDQGLQSLQVVSPLLSAKSGVERRVHLLAVPLVGLCGCDGLNDSLVVHFRAQLAADSEVLLHEAKGEIDGGLVEGVVLVLQGHDPALNPLVPAKLNN